MFLLTNSEWYYTNQVMSYLLDSFDPNKKWRDYFDIVIVSANKPAFFADGANYVAVSVSVSVSVSASVAAAP